MNQSFLVYRHEMARGWESKAVEAQQDAALERAASAPKVSIADSARLAERATLSLARTRALADLQVACAAAHRAMLQQAIADLDKRLAALENPKTQGT
ncbi:MAG TPA: hypothetical protein VN654_21560 [Vicinamibacterales bacterium]|nr:hypothetical protein [Vicinamibacterales bacterium]